MRMDLAKDICISILMIIAVALGAINIFGLMSGLSAGYAVANKVSDDPGACQPPFHNVVRYTIPTYRLGCWLMEKH